MMTEIHDSSHASRRRSADHPGPPPLAPLVVSVLALAGGVLSGPIVGGGSVPDPSRATETVRSYFADHPTVTAVDALLLLLSTVALVFFSAVLFSRLQFLAPNAPGPPIAFAGGLIAAGLLAVAVVTQWVLSRHTVTEQGALTHALNYLEFAAGGPAHVAALGVLLLGASVTALFISRTPRWLSAAGIVLAGVDVAASAALVTDHVVFLVPVGRFGSMLWLLAFSALLPRGRAARRTERSTAKAK